MIRLFIYKEHLESCQILIRNTSFISSWYFSLMPLQMDDNRWMINSTCNERRKISINSDLSFPVSPFHTHLSTSTLTGFVPLYHCFPDWKITKWRKCIKILAKGAERANKENWKGQIYILKYPPGFLLKCNLYQITVSILLLTYNEDSKFVSRFILQC